MAKVSTATEISFREFLYLFWRYLGIRKSKEYISTILWLRSTGLFWGKDVLSRLTRQDTCYIIVFGGGNADLFFSSTTHSFRVKYVVLYSITCTLGVYCSNFCVKPS